MTPAERFAAVYKDCRATHLQPQNGRAVWAHGRRWLAATNGFTLLAVQAAVGPEGAWDGFAVAGIVNVISDADQGSVPIRTTVHELSAFVGEAEFATRSTCSLCEGDGKRRCEDCGESCECECTCSRCDKGVEIDPPSARPVFICGIKLDANLVAQVLVGATGSIEVRAKNIGDQVANGRQISIVGDGWIACVMGLRDHPGDELLARWPSQEAL